MLISFCLHLKPVYTGPTRVLCALSIQFNVFYEVFYIQANPMVNIFKFEIIIVLFLNPI